MPTESTAVLVCTERQEGRKKARKEGGKERYGHPRFVAISFLIETLKRPRKSIQNSATSSQASYDNENRKAVVVPMNSACSHPSGVDLEDLVDVPALFVNWKEGRQEGRKKGRTGNPSSTPGKRCRC